MRNYLLNLTKSLMKLKVLIVDDDPEYTKALADIIKTDCNQTVLQTSNPFEAIQLVKNEVNTNSPIDVAFIDYMMPQMDGLQLSLELNKIDPELNIISISTDGSVETKLELSNYPHIITAIDKRPSTNEIESILCKILSQKDYLRNQEKSYYKKRNQSRK